MDSNPVTPVFSCVFMFLLLGSVDHAIAQDSSQARATRSQTQKGVTIQLEKITVERIVNSPALIEAEKKQSKLRKEDVEVLRQHLPARLVSFFFSVQGETKKLGPTKTDFANEGKVFSSVSRFFSPPKWQAQLPKLVVDPKASGIEVRYLLKGSTRISDVFPAEVEVQVTTTDGNTLTFKFDRVEF